MNMPPVANTQSIFQMSLIVRVVIGFGLLSGMVAIVATAGWLQYPARWEDRPSENFLSSNVLAQQTAGQSQANAFCGRCGTVEESRTVVTDSEGEVLQTAAGRNIGSLIGLQAGGGREVGMLVGALAGNAVGKKTMATSGNEVTVRLGDGSTIVIREKNSARWEPGDRVKVVNGVLRRN
jgi:outer membrane lipoprotein SlyB